MASMQSRSKMGNTRDRGNIDLDDGITEQPSSKMQKVSSSEVTVVFATKQDTVNGPDILLCAICRDNSAESEGFACSQKCGTFTCWDCLLQSYAMAGKPGAVQSGSDANGELLCSDINCRSPIKVLDLARSNASESLISAQEDFKLHVHTTKKVTDALRQQEDQIRGEYTRIEQIKDADEKAAVKLRLKIVDEALTLRCPRCRAAFLDFTGCFALRCSRNDCGCGFCAWCLLDCGYDAHNHMYACPEGKAYHSTAHGLHHGSFEMFQDHHMKRRTTAVQALLKEADLNKNATEKLRELMKKDLEDLHIKVGDVFSCAVDSSSSAASGTSSVAPAVPTVAGGVAGVAGVAVPAAAIPVVQGGVRGGLAGLLGLGAPPVPVPVLPPATPAARRGLVFRRLELRRVIRAAAPARQPPVVMRARARPVPAAGAAPAAAVPMASDRVLRSAGPVEPLGRGARRRK